jgi:hypothetical protein
MAKYRKKPVVIEAEQFFPENEPWPAGVVAIGLSLEEGGGAKQNYQIQTLEGPFVVTPGDWIITGVKGEKYPCKPDIFEATYDEVYGMEVVTPFYEIARPLPEGWEKGLCECGHSAGMHRVEQAEEHLHIVECLVVPGCSWFRPAKETDPEKVARLALQAEPLSEDDRRWLAHHTR